MRRVSHIIKQSEKHNQKIKFVMKMLHLYDVIASF